MYDESRQPAKELFKKDNAFRGHFLASRVQVATSVEVPGVWNGIPWIRWIPRIVSRS